MFRGQPGVDIDDFGLPTKHALQTAADLKFRHVELSAATDEVNPDRLTRSGRRHLQRYVENLGLGLSAVVADIPGLRFTDPAAVDERVQRTRRILDFAKDLNVRIVTASIGAVSHPTSGEISPLALEALAAIGEHAESRDCVFAVRTLAGDTEQLSRLLSRLDCRSLRVGFDPAAFVMRGENPLDCVRRFPDKIALFHARDATVGNGASHGHETRLQEGDVDLVGVFAELAEAEYDGPLILRRTASMTPIEDLADARQRVSGLMPAG